MNDRVKSEMVKVTHRAWVPSRKYVGNTTIPVSVKSWTWIKGKGLWVEFKDGTRCRSDWKSVTEFLKAVADGREYAMEVKI